MSKIEELTMLIEQSTTIDAHEKAQLKSLLIAAKEFANDGCYNMADHYFKRARDRFFKESVYGR